MPIKHNIRSNRKNGIRKVNLTPSKAIKFQCIECMGFKKSLVKGCTDQLCPLYPFRVPGKGVYD